MRIALDATPLLGERSGIGEFVVGLSGGLAGYADLELTGFAVTWRGRHLLAGRLPPNVRPCDRLIPAPAKVLHAMWKRVAFPPLEVFIGGADVVHGTNAVLPPTRRAAGVVTVHDLVPSLSPGLMEAGFLPFTELVRKAIRRGAFVHTPSEFVRGQVIELFRADPARVVAVPLGIPTRAGPAPAAGTGPAPRAQAGLPERFIAAIGTVQPRKDYPTLLRAFEIVSARDDSVHLVVAGARGWGYDEFASVLAGLSARNRVHYLGYVGGDERLELLRRSAVLAYPSLDEGFGLPPLEAMAEGVPVVATAAGSIPEVVGEAALLVPVGDEEALAGELLRLLGDEELRDEMVARGHARARLFTWEHTAAGLRDLYYVAESSR